MIDLAVSLYLYNVYKDAGEGIMTHIRASLVTQTTLSLVCKKIKLHDFLMIGKSELLNPHTNKNNFFADIFESFIGALYLDLGFDVVYNFLEIYLFSLLLKEDNLFFDYKTKLEEYMQQHKLHKLLYKIKAIIVDKEHFDTLIEVEAFYKNIKVGSATANKRKIAEQILAKDILDKCEKNQNF